MRIGRCMDCDALREITSHGDCSICGSSSVLIHGAARELRAQLKRRDRNAAKAKAAGKRQRLLEANGARDKVLEPRLEPTTPILTFTRIRNRERA